MEGALLQILALDTSSTSGSIALVKDSNLISEWTVGDVGTHADWLLRNIAAMLSNRGVTPDQIDLFAATHGPGSFTGLRIGVSTLKGLAWTLGKEVKGVSTLEVLSLNFRTSSATICPVLDARKSEVYAALYQVDAAGARAILPDSALKPESLVEEIERLARSGELPGPVVFAGSGLGVYGELLLDGVKGSTAAPQALWHARASNVALAAASGPGSPLKPAAFMPFYLRKSEAELKPPKKEQKV